MLGASLSKSVILLTNRCTNSTIHTLSHENSLTAHILSYLKQLMTVKCPSSDLLHYEYSVDNLDSAVAVYSRHGIYRGNLVAMPSASRF